MKEIIGFIKKFYQSKFNIVITVFVGLFLIALLMSNFIAIFSFIAVGLFAVNCFLIGVKVCIYSKNMVESTNKYSVFFDENDSEEVEKPKKKSKFFTLGIFLIVISFVMVYTFITMVAK